VIYRKLQSRILGTLCMFATLAALGGALPDFDFGSSPPVQRTPAGVLVPSVPQAWSPETAAGLAVRVVAGVDQLTQAIASGQKAIDKIDNQDMALDAKIRHVKTLKTRAMEEIARGEICSGCNQTRSEIESKGQHFPHPGEKIIRLSNQEVAAKQAEKGRTFDDEVNTLQKERESLFQQRKQQESKCMAYREQVQEGLNLWRTAATFREHLIDANEYAWQQREKANVKEAEEKLQRIDALLKQELGKAKPDVAMLHSAGTWREYFREVISNETERGDNQYRRFLREKRAASEERRNQYNQLESALFRTHDFDNRVYVTSLSSG
jgi:hypothetical protein